jgi:hypothetical protein
MNTPRKTMMTTGALLALAVVSTAAPDLGRRHARVVPAAQHPTAAAASAVQHTVNAAAEPHTETTATTATTDPSVPSAHEVFKHRDVSPPEAEVTTF